MFAKDINCKIEFAPKVGEKKYIQSSKAGPGASCRIGLMWNKPIPLKLEHKIIAGPKKIMLGARKNKKSAVPIYSIPIAKIISYSITKKKIITTKTIKIKQILKLNKAVLTKFSWFNLPNTG